MCRISHPKGLYPSIASGVLVDNPPSCLFQSMKCHRISPDGEGLSPVLAGFGSTSCSNSFKDNGSGYMKPTLFSPRWLGRLVPHSPPQQLSYMQLLPISYPHLILVLVSHLLSRPSPVIFLLFFGIFYIRVSFQCTSGSQITTAMIS